MQRKRILVLFTTNNDSINIIDNFFIKLNSIQQLYTISWLFLNNKFIPVNYINTKYMLPLYLKINLYNMSFKVLTNKEAENDLDFINYTIIDGSIILPKQDFMFKYKNKKYKSNDDIKENTENTENNKRVIVPNTIVKHFKRELCTDEELKSNKYLYKVIGVAKYTENIDEKFVIYQALYDNYQLYARPLNMFLSKVDTKKYPNVKQLYRFEIYKN